MTRHQELSSESTLPYILRAVWLKVVNALGRQTGVGYSAAARYALAEKED